MKQSDFPKKHSVSFGTDGWRLAIKDEIIPDSNNASYPEGFPPPTQIPLTQGGSPPKGRNINQILYELSDILRAFSAGMPSYYDSDFSSKINGYPISAVVAGDDDILYISLFNNNIDKPEKDSDKWDLYIPKPPLSVYIGEIRLLPFRKSGLPKGWYLCDGSPIELSSAEGQALNGLSVNYKADWAVTVTEDKITLPDVFKDNRDNFLRPVQSPRFIGDMQGDALRNITGELGTTKVYSNAIASGVFKKRSVSSRTCNGEDSDGGVATFDLNNINYPIDPAEIRPYNIGLIPCVYLGVYELTEKGK